MRGGGLGEMWPWWVEYTEAWVKIPTCTPPHYDQDDMSREVWMRRMLVYTRALDAVRAAAWKGE